MAGQDLNIDQVATNNVKNLQELVCLAEKTNNEEQFWIGDSGASHHMTNSNIWMFNMRKATDESVQIGDGTKLDVKYVGDVIGHVIQDDGSTFLATIRNVSYMPDIICNLYSTTTAIANGMKISNL